EQAMEEDQRQVEVEQLRAAWEASPDARTVGDLESETLRLLRVFQEAPKGSAVPMDDLTAAAARILDIDANTSAARRGTAAPRHRRRPEGDGGGCGPGPRAAAEAVGWVIRRATLVAQETDRREPRGVMTDKTSDTMSLIAQAEAEAEALEALMAQRIADADE